MKDEDVPATEGTPGLARRPAALMALGLVAGAAAATTGAKAQTTTTKGPTPQAMAESRIALIETQLAITAAQATDWDVVAAVIRKNATNRAIERSQLKAITNSVDRLNAVYNFTTSHARDLAAFIAVFKLFYAKLSPAQQAAADAIFAR